MATIFDLSSGTIESGPSYEGGVEIHDQHPDDRPGLQLAMQEAVCADTCTGAQPALVRELLKKL
jgi:hypothetical protein